MRRETNVLVVYPPFKHGFYRSVIDAIAMHGYGKREKEREREREREREMKARVKYKRSQF